MDKNYIQNKIEHLITNYTTNTGKIINNLTLKQVCNNKNKLVGYIVKIEEE